MLLRKLKLKNIRSYENLSLNFQEGSTLLSGDIGAGKTSVLLALQFALFGLQPGQKGTSILRHGKNEASVSLEFEIDDKRIILERTLKRNRNKSITQDFNLITINDETQELSTSEMKTKVISLLNYPKEFLKKSNLLYKFTVYTPQEEMKAIIQENPEVRLDTLRYIFGIDRYKRINENSQILLQKIKETIKIKEIEILELNKLKESLTKETENKIKLSRELNSLKLEHTNLLKERGNIQEKINSLEKTIQEKNEFHLQLEKLDVFLQGKKDLKSRMEKEIFLMQKQIEKKVEFSEEQLKSVLSLLEKHKKILEELNSEFLDINSNVSVLNSKKEQVFQLKEKIGSLENCPTCLQSVSKEHKEKMSKKSEYKIEDINRELEQKLIEKARLIKDIDAEKKFIQDYDSDKVRLQEDKIRFFHQREVESKLKSDIFILERTIEEIKEIEEKIRNLKLNLANFKEIKEDYDSCKKNLELINEKYRLKEIQNAEKGKELELLKLKIDNLTNEISEKQKKKEQINLLRELQDWFQEKFLSIVTLAETNVMAKLRSEFSTIFSEWFSILVSDSLSVRLDEDFTPIITNQDYEFDYDFLSGGERTAVALAYRLALNQVLNSLLSRIKTKDIIILDEPTDGFSEQQLDKMRDIFEQLNSKQMILVSHEQKMEDFVENIIRIKKDGISFLEEKQT